LPLLPEVYQLFAGAPGEDVEEAEAESDERRLFYVALTRAKKQIFVSYASEAEGRSMLPSPFLSEIDEALVESVDVAQSEDEFESKRAILVSGPETVTAMRLTDQAYIRDLFIKNGLSVSALNNYLKSPWQYLYRNLIRIPEAPSKHQAYGIAVHAALQDMFDTYREGDLPTKEWLVERFLEHLDRQPWVSSDEYRESKQKGEEHLPLWYADQKDTWVKNSKTELRVNAVYLEPDVRLNGVFDKVEILDDGTVNVVDYKTGKPKTRNDIMGETKSSTGDYYRQLVFYKLLLRHHEGGKYRMRTGEIVFVAPDSRGQFRREKFEISEEEVDELENQIRQVADEIMNLRFWDTACDPDSCNYCDLVEHIKENA
jgi:DNA helicase-2/ATP-dependent DNA helicase PcrA